MTKSQDGVASFGQDKADRYTHGLFSAPPGWGRVGVRVLRGLETTPRFSPILIFPRQGRRSINLLEWICRA
jgi:hypothetical protein